MVEELFTQNWNEIVSSLLVWLCTSRHSTTLKFLVAATKRIEKIVKWPKKILVLLSLKRALSLRTTYKVHYLIGHLFG